MADTPKRRSPAWKIFLGSATMLLVLAGSAALWIRSAAERKYAALQERLRAMDVQALAPDPTPRPDKVPGNAWDDYAVALAEASKVLPADRLLVVAPPQEPDIAFIQAALAAHGASVDRILTGSRRASCLPPGEAALPALWQWMSAVRLAIHKARFLRDEGNPAASVEILLALCQFGRDLSESGLAVAAGFPYPALEIPFEELSTLLASGSLLPGVIAEIDSRLEGLENAFPRPDKLRMHHVRLVAETNAYLRNSGIVGEIASWRFGFSPRLLTVSAFERWEQWFVRSCAADRLPWPQAQALIGEIRAEIDRTPFSSTGTDLPSVFLMDGSHARAALAHLRILRTAARYRRTGQILELQDPFGDKLCRRDLGDRLMIWSVGVDGVDQGSGSWMSRPIGDIVLVVPR